MTLARFVIRVSQSVDKRYRDQVFSIPFFMMIKKVELISVPVACFPGGVRRASSSLRSCGVSTVTLIPQESSAFHSNQLVL